MTDSDFFNANFGKLESSINFPLEMHENRTKPKQSTETRKVTNMKLKVSPNLNEIPTAVLVCGGR